MDYESEGLMVTHQAARDLFEIGVIDAEEMRKFDTLCLPGPKSAARREPQNRSNDFCGSSGKQAVAPVCAAAAK